MRRLLLLFSSRALHVPSQGNPFAIDILGYARSGLDLFFGSFTATWFGLNYFREACFAIFARPALVIKRDCSYISIHSSLEIAEISLPIASRGKSSGDLK